MGQNLYYLILLGLFQFACKEPILKKEFDLYSQPKTILARDGAAEFFYWEFEDSESIWEANTKELAGIVSFQDTLKLLLGPDRYSQVVQKEATQSYHPDSLLNISNGDKKNAMLTHTGTVGEIRPINALEAQILNYQLLKYSYIGHPTEFHGFIAFHAEQKKYRVYFAASDQPWPPKPNPLIRQLEEDMKKGWKLRYHLHNHYEPPSNDYLGILAPSMSDAQYFKMLAENYQVEQAMITNGIHTVVIDAADFPAFEAYE